ncbi:hypothetical protein B5P45_04570 [Phyllobacterium zundukense]|uniref:Uncharacterized protein n=1 Tax=Phyllobacterium zundukense TaxID=1867719 RepID=A0A2N9W253_9HYPH|nr:hypothetical protein BLM14_05860 [Phyllobacterium zundukense]PIO45821.1 hypothetical protein B5P45_04570 [Phyllobacterium zundukense]
MPLAPIGPNQSSIFGEAKNTGVEIGFIHSVQTFVVVPSASSRTFVYASFRQKLPDWIVGQRALSFSGDVKKAIVAAFHA